MTQSVTFRRYVKTDRASCLDIFDENCPEYFAPKERADYQSFLNELTGDYEVCVVAARVVGAYGLETDNSIATLNWILLSREHQNCGIGSTIMKRIIAMSRQRQAQQLNIATSQKACDFFARFGAIAKAQTKDGWGVGLDRVDMVLSL